MAHLNEKQLSKLLEKAKSKVKIGDIYYHYKNPQRYYVVDFVGLLEAREEPCIAYRALYGKKFLWVRAFNEFTKVEEINGKKVRKFTKVEGIVRLSAVEARGRFFELLDKLISGELQKIEVELEGKVVAEIVPYNK